jgi:hypothetical protein
LAAGVVDSESFDELVGPAGESSTAGERRCVLVFLATLFGDELPKSYKLETLAIFPKKTAAKDLRQKDKIQRQSRKDQQ